MVTTVCEWCGGPNSRRGRWCSDRCRYAARDRKRHTPAGTELEAVCAICKRPFTYLSTTKPRRYCGSDRCRRQADANAAERTRNRPSHQLRTRRKAMSSKNSPTPDAAVVYAAATVACVTAEGVPVVLHEGDMWAADDALVLHRPDLFTSEPGRSVRHSTSERDR